MELSDPPSKSTFIFKDISAAEPGETGCTVTFPQTVWPRLEKQAGDILCIIGTGQIALVQLRPS